MRIQGVLNDCRATVSAADTYAWAHKVGASWPCSTLSGKRIAVTVSRGDIVDFTVNGRNGDVDGNELDAMLRDLGIRA